MSTSNPKTCEHEWPDKWDYTAGYGDETISRKCNKCETTQYGKRGPYVPDPVRALWHPTAGYWMPCQHPDEKLKCVWFGAAVQYQCECGEVLSYDYESGERIT